MTKIDRLNKAIDSCGDSRGRRCQFCPYKSSQDCHLALIKDMRDLMKALELREV